MKAIVVHEYGGPEVLKFEEYPDPVPGPGEVPLEQARRAHEMLANAPHKRGKIVLTMHGVH